MAIHNKKAAEAIVEAAKIDRRMKEDRIRLDELKAIIREEANKVATRLATDEKVEFASDEGVATVVFVSDRVDLVKGANPIILKTVLPEETWDHLFKQEIVLSPEFKDSFQLLPKNQQNAVKKLVAWKPCEPRVTLPK